MNQINIEANDINMILDTKFYTYKEKKYEVIKIIKMKSPVSNVWLNGVEYKPLYEIPSTEWQGSFVRSVANFLELFKPTGEIQ